MTGVSLHTIVDHPPDAEVLLRAWADALRQRLADLERGGIAGLIGDWRRRSVGLGLPVTVAGASGSFGGIAIDVADDGALLVDSDGEIHHVLAGDVHLAPIHRRPVSPRARVVPTGRATPTRMRTVTRNPARRPIR